MSIIATAFTRFIDPFDSRTGYAASTLLFPTGVQCGTVRTHSVRRTSEERESSGNIAIVRPLVAYFRNTAVQRAKRRTRTSIVLRGRGAHLYGTFRTSIVLRGVTSHLNLLLYSFTCIYR